MKQLILTFFGLLLWLSASAQITHTSSGTVDQQAKQILDKASKKVNTSAVSFSVTMVTKDSDKKETSRMNATVLFNKGKYRVSFADQVMYCDGNALWHWNKAANECVVNPLDALSGEELMNPAALLSSYSTNFRAKYIRTENDGTAVVDLTPKKARSYHKVRLLISSETGIIKRMEIHNYDGSRSEYTVSQFKSGVACKEGDFTFPRTQNPKVEIIDMR